MSHYIGRLAPSPTGLLHLGHAATFWQAYARAQDHNGALLLRNEDLDPQRSKLEYVTAFLEDLAWLGVIWTPPMISQSERVPLYRAAFERLLHAGLAYPCTCSRRELTQMTQAPHEDTEHPQHPTDDEPVYNNQCRTTTAEPQTFHPQTNYRFRTPDVTPVSFTDLNLGRQTFTTGHDFGDFLIWRKDNLPSYQLACVVDDADTRVTEVVRGADLLKSTARQILLQKALSLPTPRYFHTHLLRDEHGVRLAKRHDALAIRTLRQHGLSPAEVLHMTSTVSVS